MTPHDAPAADSMPETQLHSSQDWTKALDIWGAVAVLAALITGLVIFARKYLPAPNIWFDESGQYWLSRGLNHDSAIDAAPQWIGAGVLNGMTGFNLDPPGFTVALGATIQVFGSSSAALRLLPFAAFVATIAIFYLLGRRILQLPRTLSLGLPPLALTTSLPMFYATEIRAYSAELLAVAAALITTATLVRSRSIRGAVPFIITLILGALATRYYFIVAAASSGLVYVVALVIDNMWRQRARQIITVVVAYFITAVGAAWSIGLIGPGTQIGYGRGYAQSGASLAKSEDPITVVLANLATGEQRATGLFLALGTITLMIRSVRRRIEGRTKPRPLWVLLWALVLSYEATAATLSYFADIPWDSSGRWSIGLWAMAASSLLGLGSMAASVIGSIRAPARQWIAVAATAFVVIPSVATSTQRLMNYERPDFRVLGSNLIDLVKENVDPSLQTQWVVDYWTWPGFRWLTQESGLWPKEFLVEDAQPVGDGVQQNRNWPDVIPFLPLCVPGTQTLILHERVNDTYDKRAAYIESWALKQRCRVERHDLGPSEMLLVISPPFS